MSTASELSARLADLLRDEHHALAEFLVALASFDEAEAWSDLGHRSLFDYLHRRLGLSKGAAFYRLTAAQLIQRHPEVTEPLRSGALCLTSVVELSKVLTPGNVGEVLPRFFHASKREAQAIAAELRPAESVPRRTVVTAVAPAPLPIAAPPRSEPAVHRPTRMTPVKRRFIGPTNPRRSSSSGAPSLPAPRSSTRRRRRRASTSRSPDRC